MKNTKSAYEAARKRLRQLQRELAPDWSTLAVESMAAFKIETGLALYSTAAGRQLRVRDGRKFRKLSHNENCRLWTVVRDHLERRGCRLSCKIIRTGLRAIGLMVEVSQ